MSYGRKDRGRLARAGWRTATIAALVVGVTACESMLDVELPGNLTEEDLYQPESAEILVSSFIADFECAFSMYAATMSGAEDATWKTSGYFTVSTEYQTQRPAGGACTTNSDVGTDWFQGFQKSRLLAETAYEYLSTWTDAEVPNREVLQATAAVYAGLFYAHLGEVYCEFALPGEPLMTPTDMLEAAEAWLTTALGIMGTDDFSVVSTSSLKQFALLVRARVRLAMADLAGAAADADLIQPDFVAYVTRDASVRPRWNAVHQAFNATRWRSFAGPVWWYGHAETQLVSAGYLNLTVDETTGMPTVDSGVTDPRVPLTFTGQFAQDGVTDQYTTEKYTGLGDNQRLATWAEAQYILAEIEGGQQAVARINAVRAGHGLPDFVSADDDEIYSVLIEERRREFFLEGRHHADKLRFGLWFPRGRGWNHKQVRYGLEYCLLMPENAYELNEAITAGYTGPDLSDLGYDFELKVSRVANWPVPSSLP